MKTFAKLTEKADRQPVCIELKLKTSLMFYKCRVIVLVQRILRTFAKIAVKYYYIMYCVIVGTITSKGNKNFL